MALCNLAALALCLPAPHQEDHLVRLAPIADNTLYQTTDGSLSNGAGERIFAGVTASGLTRRCLLLFDVSALPDGVRVTWVELGLYISKTPLLPPPSKLGLHRVTAPWGEGASDAQGEEGAGAPSEQGDATWLHSSYPGTHWASPGGDYLSVPSAKAVPESGLVPIAWSSHAMVRDVQGWLDAPLSNHGWLIRDTKEQDIATAKRFNSREFAADRGTRPVLMIRYQHGPEPCTQAAECSGNATPVEISTCSCLGGESIVTLSGGPPGEPVLLLIGAGDQVVPMPGGDLCIGGSEVLRYGLDAGQVTGQGTFSVDIFNALTGGGGRALPGGEGNLCSPPGQTFGFQFWYRSASAPHLSRATRVTFR